MHTPGPWKVVSSWDERIVEIKYRSGTIVSWRGFDNTPKTSRMGNARLIASAPDLLAALEGMIEMHEKLSKKINWGASFLDAESIRLMNDRPIAAQAAIAKAKGS